MAFYKIVVDCSTGKQRTVELSAAEVAQMAADTRTYQQRIAPVDAAFLDTYGQSLVQRVTALEKALQSLPSDTPLAEPTRG